MLSRSWTADQLRHAFRDRRKSVGGRRLRMPSWLPEYVELGRDASATYAYVANGQNGPWRPLSPLLRSESSLPTASVPRPYGPTRAWHAADVLIPPYQHLWARFYRAPPGARDGDHRRRQNKELAGRLPLEPISERTLERSATARWVIDQGVQVDYAAGARAGPSLFGDPTSRLVTPDLLSGLMAGGEIRRDGGVVVADACAGDIQHGAVAWRCDPQLALSKVDTIVRARVPVSV